MSRVIQRMAGVLKFHMWTCSLMLMRTALLNTRVFSRIHQTGGYLNLINKAQMQFGAEMDSGFFFLKISFP